MYLNPQLLINRHLGFNTTVTGSFPKKGSSAAGIVTIHTDGMAPSCFRRANMRR
ncbi:MAG: hypothetical protein N2110_01060 [Flavobacteriales bacterium]|nr:hypothetical protein [Flavobacteriales bacterium]